MTRFRSNRIMIVLYASPFHTEPVRLELFYGRLDLFYAPREYFHEIGQLLETFEAHRKILRI